MTGMTAARGVLFDIDGTLVDTTYLHAVAWAEALRDAGHHVPTAQVHQAIGMGGGQLLDRLLGEGRDHSADDDLKQAHITLYKQHWGRLDVLPGARELLRRCKEAGLTVVLASSASSEELEELRSTLDVDDAIDVATTADDADASKPHPDILQVALDRSGLAADQAVFVGDAVWDGVAAQRSGITFLGVTCGGTPAADLREAGAVEVYRDPADLLASFDESAIGRLLAAVS
jgi:HAD superfamily hydrolase (TIGR01509 family)